MRDHRSLKAYQLADKLCLMIYIETKTFPKDETFGLRSQIRRAAVSVVSDITEGCGRNTDADFLRFLDMAFGSIRELEYQVSLGKRLNYFNMERIEDLELILEETIRVLRGLIDSFRNKL
ncbi:four helix bundle protein [bacterium]|nr:four helix bundle protein [bacterium]